MLGFLLDELSNLLDRIRQDFFDPEEGAHKPVDQEPLVPSGKSFLQTIKLIIAQVLKEPDSLARHYADFAEEVLRIFQNESELYPRGNDFRFKNKLWQESPFLRGLMQLYLAWGGAMQAWLDEQELTETDHKRIRFIFEQLVAVAAPSNSLLNPSALRRAKSTNGESVVVGLQNLIDDVIHHSAMPRQVSPTAYKIGKDLALTEGAVVYRDDRLELIQYSPQTAAVRRRPMLLIPPQINKYYVFDLAPDKSLIGHLIRAGLQMFVLSWRNPSKGESDWSLDRYIESIIKAMDTIRAITCSRTVGITSACAGAYTATALLGYLAEIGDHRVASHSILITCLLPNKGSDLELFLTPELLDRTKSFTENQGVMEGKDLATIFSWFRPNDLVWRYWINNYLLGKNPPPLDVLFWDNDSTRLPAALHRDFIEMYRRDVFQTPGKLEILGHKIDFRKMTVDSYFVGGADDYIMPWKGCYQASQIFRGRHEFVLTPGGHVQSIVRPPYLPNLVYYTNNRLHITPEEWLKTAARHEGTWWTHWHAWLNDRSGATKNAPKRLGNKDYPPLMSAPGSYVVD